MRVLSSCLCFLFVLGLVFSFGLIPSVSASSVLEDSYFDLLDYYDGDLYHNVYGSIVTIDGIFNSYFVQTYSSISIDFIIHSEYVIDSLRLGYEGNYYYFEPLLVDDHLYRFVGDLPLTKWGFAGYTFSLVFPVTGYYQFSLISLRCSPSSYNLVPFTSTFYYNDGNKYHINLEDDNIFTAGQIDYTSYPVNYLCGPRLSGVYSFMFDQTLWISSAEWQKYDVLTLRYAFYVTALNSIQVRIGNQVVPFDTNFVNNSGYYLSTDGTNYDINTGDTISSFVDSNGYSPLYVTLVIDLSNVDRSFSDSLGISISGSYSDELRGYRNNYCVLYNISGIIVPEPVEVDVFWIRRIYNAIINLINGDGSGSQALVTQEEVNSTVNVQIADSVADWNTNITLVDTGFDMAWANVFPALTWVSGLADGIFNNMGWFANIFFMIGLVSVIMLLLSKSGLAHKIKSDS